ncbi:hypothetical protein JOM56_007228 [Amanita muscaria]
MEVDQDELDGSDADYIDADESEQDAEDGELDDRPDDQVRVNANTHGESPGVTTRSTSVAAYLDFSDLIYQCRAISPCDDESKSRDELLEEVLTLRRQLQKLCDAFDMQAASIRAANAHCTIVKRALEDCRTQLQNNTKKKERGSSKVKARYLTAPSLREAFDIEDIERQRCEKEAAEKEAQRAAETDARNARIAEDAASKVFDQALSSYKTKEPLLAIANALKISDKGTKADLINRIQQHLDNNPQLRDNPRFAGLFQIPGSRRRLNHTETPASESSSTSSSSATQAQVTQYQQAAPQPATAPHVPDPYTYFNTFYNTALPPYHITHPMGWPPGPGPELQAQAQASLAHNHNLSIRFNRNQ